MAEFLYKFACFDCHLAFKRKATLDKTEDTAHLSNSEITHKCPACQSNMAFMGRNFAPPPKSKKSEWVAARKLWEAGFRFCGSGYHTSPALPTKPNEVNCFISANPNHEQKVAIPTDWSNHA